MKAKIFSHQKIIGTSELRITDKSMGVVSGNFNPNGYYKIIRKTIQNYNDPSVNSNDDEFYELRLNAQLENGIFLFPLGGFLILDLEGVPEHELIFEAAGNNWHLLAGNFLDSHTKMSYIKPWELISIDQKLAFEDELQKEIGKNKTNGLFSFLRLKKHDLCDYEFSAMAKLNSNDEVLFAIHKNVKNSFEYAVVHLTGKGALETNINLPKTEYFKDFESFLQNRMKLDIRD